MAVLMTAVTRIRDWQALQALSDHVLLGLAQAAGASRYQVYRNARDASEVLLVMEFPSHDAARQMAEAADRQEIALLYDSLLSDRVWEPTECDRLGR